MTENWPVAELDTVRRLRILAAAQPSALFVEDLVPAPFEAVWAVAADLENELPTLLPDVRSLTVTATDGERLEAYARGYGGVRARFDIVLSPGWCLMQSRFLLGGMAAVPDGDGTRFAFLGGFRFPGARLLRPALRPLGDHYGPMVLRRLRSRLDIG
ncbi:SRPBCC family protein [Streptomyces sp. G-G2]|uniref:SRPBCC family protein n=1 Tax=Streptomyces sp. G-G2 TaxID=3046201 RepID=UPI0024BB3E27|nr:SRPBCC family protein [Streptomyces sp. G-G2]MDJ0383655.1 SRPBCC family protein [Streptomyces sp. G-G2]